MTDPTETQHTHTDETHTDHTHSDHADTDHTHTDHTETDHTERVPIQSDHTETATAPWGERGHEPTVLSGRTMALWGAALAGLIAVALFVSWGLWQWLSVSGPRRVAPGEATPRDLEHRLATQPPLNPNQPATRRDYERQQETLLREYAWVDRQTETARIPIGRAMELVVERARAKK